MLLYGQSVCLWPRPFIGCIINLYQQFTSWLAFICPWKLLCASMRSSGFSPISTTFLRISMHRKSFPSRGLVWLCPTFNASWIATVASSSFRATFINFSQFSCVLWQYSEILCKLMQFVQNFIRVSIILDGVCPSLCKFVWTCAWATLRSATLAGLSVLSRTSIHHHGFSCISTRQSTFSATVCLKLLYLKILFQRFSRHVLNFRFFSKPYTVNNY